MNQTDQCDLLKFVVMIMSSKSKEEQESEALKCLQSNPGILHSLIKLGMSNCKTVNTQDNAETENVEAVSDNYPVQSKSHEDTSGLKNQDNVHIGHKVGHTSICSLSCEQGVSPKEMSKATYTKDDNFEQTKRRKSKYSDIKGDLSHIYREPKSSKQNKCSTTNTPHISGEESVVNYATRCSSEHECNVIFVKRLLQMLQNPKSVRQQECVIGLLQEDSELREIFIDEKTKLGKSAIKVFKNVQPQTQTQTSFSSDVKSNITLDVQKAAGIDERVQTLTDPFESLFKSNSLLTGNTDGNSTVDVTNDNTICVKDTFGTIQSQTDIEEQVSNDTDCFSNMHRVNMSDSNSMFSFDDLIVDTDFDVIP